MPKYQVVEQAGQFYIPIRYDNFGAINAPVEPPVPWAAVPFYRSIAEVVAQARGLEAEFSQSLTARGVHRVRAITDRFAGAGTPSSVTDKDDRVGYADKLALPFRFFRGERSLDFSIMPTRYRFAGQPDPLATTRQRIAFEMQCAHQIKEYLACHGAPTVSIEQARAAARHYGSPSSFVDFTFNPEVAAHFAHPAFNDGERLDGADIGILYSLGVDDFERLCAPHSVAIWTIPPEGGRDVQYLLDSTVLQIPYRSFDPAKGILEDATLRVTLPAHMVARPLSIRTRIVPEIQRIAAQEGIFLELSLEEPEDWWTQVFLWTVLDFASRKWCFLRHDHVYENLPAGISSAKLLPPDDPELDRVASECGRCPW